LQARSTEGVGSSFIVTLPRVVDPETLRSDLDELLTEPAGYHQRLVHYVEDNETNAEVMRGILARRPQVLLQVSSTGREGLTAISRTLPDLILLDMHLPDISGMEVLRKLKSDPATAEIPVVIVSADALKATQDAALAAGAKRYLSKPVSVPELLALVDQLLVALHTRM
jgi:CheY-like chemotaxis protein